MIQQRPSLAQSLNETLASTQQMAEVGIGLVQVKPFDSSALWNGLQGGNMFQGDIVRGADNWTWINVEEDQH